MGQPVEVILRFLGMSAQEIAGCGLDLFCAGAIDATMLLLLLYGILFGGFLSLSWIAFISFIYSRARTFFWISLTALIAGVIYLTSNTSLLQSVSPRLSSLHDTSMPMLAAAASLCFLAFLASMAQRDSIIIPDLKKMTGIAVFLILLNTVASATSEMVSDAALLATIGACAFVIFHTWRRAVSMTMTSMIVATVGAVMLTLVRHLSYVANAIDGQALSSAPTALYLPAGALFDMLSAATGLTLLVIWYHHIGTQRSAARSVLAIWQAKEHVRLSREVKRQTLALNQALAYADEKNKQKMQTLGYVGHDLRAPLATILGYVRLLRNTPRAPSMDHLGAIERSVNFQLALIDDVLEYAKSELQPLHLHATAISPAKLLNDLVSHAYTLGQANQNRFVYSPPESLPEQLLLDANRLQQVLMNLLSNASKYTLRGTFTLTMRAQAGAKPDTWLLHFSVEDDGIGIDLPEQTSIFDAFRQLERSSAGVGLGLFIAEGIVEKMGGTLTLKSSLGKGSTFSFEVLAPVVDATMVPVRPFQIGDLGPQPRPAAVTAEFLIPPAPARLELALLARDGRISGIEDWLDRVKLFHPEYRAFYDAVRQAVLQLDLHTIEALALQAD